MCLNGLLVNRLRESLLWFLFLCYDFASSVLFEGIDARLWIVFKYIFLEGEAYVIVGLQMR